jgi:hypothetical protein
LGGESWENNLWRYISSQSSNATYPGLLMMQTISLTTGLPRLHSPNALKQSLPQIIFLYILLAEVSANIDQNKVFWLCWLFSTNGH